jgi:hypothetical protein
MLSTSAALFAGLLAAGNVTTLLTIQDSHITEASGLVRSVRHPGVLWTHNDGGTNAIIYGIGKDGRTVARLTLRGIDPYDPEALSRGVDASGKPALFLGDIGDNAEKRTNVSVFRVSEPGKLSRRTVRATWYRFRYPDGPHDAEALLVSPQDGRIWIATKSFGPGGLYVAPQSLVEESLGTNKLRRVASVPPLVTDGAFLPGGRFVLRTYTSVFVYDKPGKLRDQLTIPVQPQGESVAYDGDRLLYGSEGVHSKVQAVPLPDELTGRTTTTPTKSAPPAAAESGTSPFGDEAVKVLALLLAGAVVASFLVFAVARLNRDR